MSTILKVTPLQHATVRQTVTVQTDHGERELTVFDYGYQIRLRSNEDGGTLAILNCPEGRKPGQALITQLRRFKGASL